MSAFVYFVPGLEGTVATELVAKLPAELRILFGAHVPAFRPCREGPGGGPGMAVRFSETGNGYYPQKQTWEAGNGYWIGFYNDERPRPVDLERPQMVAGYDVELGDGQVWSIPCRTHVERRVRFRAADGWTNGAALPEQQPLLEAADRAFDIMKSEEKGGKMFLTADTNAAAEIATAALGVNYFIGPAEISLLELLSSRNLFAVLQAVIDMPAIVEVVRRQNGNAQADPSRRS